jgi:integrase
VRISVPFSKRQLSPVTLTLVRRPDELCPLAALAALLPRLGRLSERTPLISMSYITFNSMLKRQAAGAGISHAAITSHSFRRGGATTLFGAGVPPPLSKALGRWKSMTWMDYVEFDFELQRVPTAMLLSHSLRD